MRTLTIAALAMLSLSAVACGAEPSVTSDPTSDPGAPSAPSGGVDPSDPSLPMPPKVPGPAAKDTKARVWTVDQAWSDTDTDRAKEAGVAWAAGSGLTWEQKYARWLESFERIPTAGDPDHETLRLKTPYGARAFDGPVLECADVAVFLRVAFASFYGLPFYMQGTRNGKPIYVGHFGVVDEDGDPVSGYPLYESTYASYEGKWSPGDAWPSDAAGGWSPSCGLDALSPTSSSRTTATSGGNSPFRRSPNSDPTGSSSRPRSVAATPSRYAARPSPGPKAKRSCAGEWPAP